SVNTSGNAVVAGVAAGTTVVTAKLPNNEASVGVPVTVTAAAAQGCWPVPSAVTFKVTKISDPGGFDGTITLGNAGQITVNVSATATPGKIQIVGGGKMNGWNVDKVDVNGSAPSTANACAVDLNEGAVFFGPGNHKTRLVGNASVTPGTKLRLQFLNFNTGALQTEYELEVVSVN
ncbi:MAG TPA: hypothetical protein VM100_01320, partial [Longimicrobiales bacterium]|nr:hypothetical protein [Longimicrobiales bacterium]